MFLCKVCKKQLKIISRKRDGVMMCCHNCNTEKKITFVVKGKSEIQLVKLLASITQSLLNKQNKFKIYKDKKSDIILYCKHTEETFYLHCKHSLVGRDDSGISLHLLFNTCHLHDVIRMFKLDHE